MNAKEPKKRTKENTALSTPSPNGALQQQTPTCDMDRSRGPTELFTIRPSAHRRLQVRRTTG